MGTFSQFDAFKLDKVQMNAIAGGEIYCQDKSGRYEIVFGDGIKMEDAQAAAEVAMGESVCEEVIRV